MKNLTELMLSFPEMDECEKQSTKGGSDDYAGWSWGSGGWGQWGGQDGQGTYYGGNLGTVTITPSGNPPSGQSG